MKTLIKLAWRNVLRNRRRTLITVAAVGFGMGVFIALSGIMDAFENKSIENLKKLDTAHIKVFEKGYWDNKAKEPLEHLINDYRGIENKIASIKGVESVTGRIQFPATLYFGRYDSPCMGIGIDAEKGDPEVFELKNSIEEGEYKVTGQYALIGKDMAEVMDMKVGGFLTLEFKDKNEVYDAIQVEVSGIFNTGHPNIDANVVYLPLKLTQERLGMKNSVTEIAVKLTSERRMKSVMKQIDTAIGEKNSAMTWKEQAEDYLKFAAAKNKGRGIMMTIVFVIVIVGIWNTMLMSVLERENEIGTIMALGMRKRRISAMFLTEGAIIGFSGAVLGCVLGFLFMIYFSKTGINLNAFTTGRDAGYIVKDIVYGKLSLRPFMQALFSGTIVAVLASYFPARNAAKNVPAEILRRV